MFRLPYNCEALYVEESPHRTLLLTVPPLATLVFVFNAHCNDTIQDESIRGLVYTVTHNKVGLRSAID